MANKANERQVGGKHYATGDYQHWDVVADFGLDYFQGQITRYLFRWKAKGGIEDLEKAGHYLDKYLELARDGKVKIGTGSDLSRPLLPIAVKSPKRKTG